MISFVILASATLAGAADLSDACPNGAAGEACTAQDVEDVEELALLQRKGLVVSEASAAVDDGQDLFPSGPGYAKSPLPPPKCARVVYEARYALPSEAQAAGMVPPMALATTANMDANIVSLGLNFTGLWWTRDNPAPSQIVSFADATANSSTYPARLEMRDMLEGHWSFSDGAAAQATLALWSTMNPSTPMDFNFENSTFADIPTELSSIPLVWVDQYLFQKINDDEWNRISTFQNGSIFNGFYTEGHNYTLVRVAYEDGTPHPKFWPEFLARMTSEGKPGAQKLISYSSDDTCMRKCQVALSCSKCQFMCR